MLGREEQVKVIDSHRETELRTAIERFFFGFRAFTALPDDLLAERGLGRTHHRILYFVRRQPGISVGALLGILGITKQAAHGPLRELERQGLLVGRPGTDDRRVRRLEVTQAGTALESELSGIQMRVLERAFRIAGGKAEAGWAAVMDALAPAPATRSDGNA